ncbi:MAG: type II secretion system minor pseudopilin GspJ [Thiogranum sp.]|jgi:general secretion pathway protein J|nr:type II secretion system minor pseudopilin GspJ [Thiogranum sp.]
MRHARGFTLLELLIALAIFALVGAMAFGGLKGVLDQKEHTMAQSQRLSDLQKAYRIMQRDLEQMVSRKIRNEFGDQVDALVGGSGFNGVEFSRAGYANPAGFLRSDIQRVAYIPDQETLLRRTWRVLDRAQDTRPDEQVLVEGMQRFSMRFLDKDNEWQDQWPPQSAVTGGATIGFPRAVEVQLELDDVGTLSWLFPLPQNAVATPQPPAGQNTGTEGGETGATGQPAAQGATP